MKRLAMLAAVGLCIFLLTGCPENVSKPPTGAQKESAATNMLTDKAAVIAGIPAIQNFTEKKMMKMLYELRDKPNLVTYSYRTDMQGTLHKICQFNSVGYGIPFAAQYTAPSVDSVNTRGGAGASTTVTRYQPEPNQLYMPDSAAATWVICAAKDKKGTTVLEPAYVEQEIVVMLRPVTWK